MILRYGISRFVGSWISSVGQRLRITRLYKDRASVDFLDPSGTPVCRPYMGGAPSVRMPAYYDDYEGRFEVELWDAGRGFTLHLVHEYEYELDEQRREALVMGISRYTEDQFLDKFYPLFGPLTHFVRE